MSNATRAEPLPGRPLTGPETPRVVVNAGALLMSLAGSWVLGAALRLLLPRLLGPERFGQLHFSDSYAGMFMVFASLGLDTYIRKELAVDAARGSRFLGGAMVTRALASGVLLALMMALWARADGSTAPASLVLLCGVGQAALSMSTTLASVLDARGLTRLSAPLAVVSKGIYASSVLLVLLMGAPLQTVPLCMVVAEGWRAWVLARLVKREVPGPWGVDMRAAWAVVVLAAPFYLNQVFHNVYGGLGVSLIAFSQGPAEAGFYGAASNLTGLMLMMMPLLPTVLMPAGVRVGAQSAEELKRFMGQAFRLLLLTSLPLAVFLMVGSREVIPLVFGHAYAPARASLLVLAPTVVITYASTLSAIFLIQTDRIWFVTWTSGVGLLLNPVANVLAIPWFQERLGAGGAGVGAAAATLLTELAVFAVMVAGGIRAPATARLGHTLLSVAAACAVAVTVGTLVPVSGWLALVLLGVAYIPAAQWTGALDLRAVVRVLREVSGRKVAPP